tara:strand:- start:390 stop:569 length:180 start_codon:yes stop_codon:yes gene_type:complete
MLTTAVDTQAMILASAFVLLGEVLALFLLPQKTYLTAALRQGYPQGLLRKKYDVYIHLV